MTINATLPPAPIFRAFDSNGKPLAGGKLYSYLTGTTTPQATYADPTGTPNDNPVILDANGEAIVYLDSVKVYALKLTDAAGATQPYYPRNGIGGYLAAGDLASTATVAQGDALVGVKQPFTGSVATTQHEVNSRTYSAFDGMSDTLKTQAMDGTTYPDVTTAVQAVINGIPGGKIEFPSGAKITLSSLTVDGKDLTFLGYGVTVRCTSTSGAFRRTTHGTNVTKVLGFDFTATVAASVYVGSMAVTNSLFLEVVFQDCQFWMLTGNFALRFIGESCSIIERCNFFQGSGVYYESAMVPYISRCIFNNSGRFTDRAVWYNDLDGTAYNCGLIIDQCQILGYIYGIEIIGTDWFVLRGSTVDFNTYSIILRDQDRALIHGNYLGGRGGTEPQVIWLTRRDPEPPTSPVPDPYVNPGSRPTYCTGIQIKDNWIVNAPVLILIDGYAVNTHITGNDLHNYTDHAISFYGTEAMAITDNDFEPAAGGGTCPILNTNADGGDSGVDISGNNFQPGTDLSTSGIQAAKLRGNRGWITESAGASASDTGSADTSIPYLMNSTPDTVQVSLNANHPHWVTIDSSTSSIIVHMDSAHSGVTIYWSAIKYRGV